MLPGLASPLLASKSFDPAALAYFGAMSTQPNATRKSLINDLIAGLKADALWAFLDELVLGAAHDAQAAKLNARFPNSATIAVHNSVTFTVDRGPKTGNSGGSNINLSALASDGSNFTAANASFGFYQNIATDPSAGGYNVYEGDNCTMRQPPAGGNPYGTINGVSAYSASNNSGVGAFSMTMVGTTASFLKNGAVQGTATGSPSLGDPKPYEVGGGSGARYAATWRGALTPAKEALFYARLLTFLTAIGAN